MMRRDRTAMLAATLVLGGCVKLAPGIGFEDVRQEVSGRLAKEIHWTRGSPEDGGAAERVDSLLARPLDADAAVQVALLNNRGLQATYEELGVAQADVVRAALPENPVFDGEFRSRGGNVGLEVSLVQDFLSLLLLPLRTRLAETAFEAAKRRVAGEVIDLAGETRRAFYRYQAAEQVLEMRRTVVEAAEASYLLARRLYQAGNTTRLDLVAEHTLAEQARNDQAAAELTVREAREQLNTLMGLWGRHVGWSARRRLPELPPEAVSPDGVERRALERSLDLDLARLRVALAARRLGLAGPLAAIPEAGLGISAEREEGDWQLGPALSLPIPLFDWGRAASAAARAELRAARERYAALAVAVRARARTLRDRLFVLRERAEHYRLVLLPLRQELVEEAQKQYNAMLIGAFQLLDAKRRQIDAGIRYIETLRDYWTTRAEMEQLLDGRLSLSRGPGPSGTSHRPGGDPAASDRGGH